MRLTERTAIRVSQDPRPGSSRSGAKISPEARSWSPEGTKVVSKCLMRMHSRETQGAWARCRPRTQRFPATLKHAYTWYAGATITHLPALGQHAPPHAIVCTCK